MNKLTESSLQQIYQWIQNKDIAGISAFRVKLTNVTTKTLIDIDVDTEYPKHQNEVRNKNLYAALLKLKYGVTRIAGSYIEDSHNEVQEESYIVVNLNDEANFKQTIFALSEYYNQDSFLYKKRGDADAFLIGTNTANLPGYKNETNQGEFNKKVSANFMSGIKSQGFAFSNNDDGNPILPDAPNTFANRKKQRKLTLEEIKQYFDITTFDQLQNNTKYLVDSFSREVMNEIFKNTTMNKKN